MEIFEMNKEQSIPSLWDVKQVAAFLNKSPSWVYEASARGDLPSIKIGGSLRFDPERLRQHFKLVPPTNIPKTKKVVSLAMHRIISDEDQ